MDGADDLAAIDPLQVDACDPKVGVAKLALDHTSGTPSWAHLDRVGVPELVGARTAV
jgi:hypothetical protein